MSIQSLTPVEALRIVLMATDKAILLLGVIVVCLAPLLLYALQCLVHLGF